DPLQHGGGAGRRVFLVRMVTLEDVPQILMLQSRCSASNNIEEEIYADRKIRSIKKADASGFHLPPYFGNELVPARSADHHVFPGDQTRTNIFHHNCRSR